jgi:hypothetical protein
MSDVGQYRRITPVEKGAMELRQTAKAVCVLRIAQTFERHPDALVEDGTGTELHGGADYQKRADRARKV